MAERVRGGLIDCAATPPSTGAAGRSAPAAVAFELGDWAEGDLVAPREQRHTAKRIWSPLVDEHGGDVAETTVPFSR